MRTPITYSSKNMKVCFALISIWVLWMYIAYLASAIGRSHSEYLIPIELQLASQLRVYNSSENLEDLHEILGIINKGRIGRIFEFLGGTIEGTENAVIRLKRNAPTRKLSPGTAAGRSNVLECKAIPPLEGRLRPDLYPRNLSLIVPPPLPCVSRHRVAVIIPYRDREEHLLTLLNTLHPLLHRQQVHYRVYVVEQFGNDTFNKGVLMNAGVRESLRDSDFGCFVFHDVDLLPEDDRNVYTCPHMPRHMSVAVDKFNYTLPYTLLVGGVFSIRLDHFLMVNGYSNLYWGWGGEDDDMAYRIKYRKLEIIRPPETIARYSMIKHDHRPESPNAIRTALLRMARKRSSRDGLNTVKYRVVWRRDHPSHTHLMVDIGRNHRWHFMDSQQRLIINF